VVIYCGTVSVWPTCKLPLLHQLCLESNTVLWALHTVQPSSLTIVNNLSVCKNTKENSHVSVVLKRQQESH